MKKLTTVLLLALLLLAFVITFSKCGGQDSMLRVNPTTTKGNPTNLSPTDPTVTSSDTPTNTDEAVPSATPTDSLVATPDPRDAEPVVRAEIKKMIADIQELMADSPEDAESALRALRSRDLTPEEKKQVDALQAELNILLD